MNIEDYPFHVRHLTATEGGGYLIEFPDLPGCMSDGDTITETIANGFDAAKCWITAAKQSKRKIPTPNSSAHSGKWLQRVPRSIHARLSSRAKIEGVSLNSLVLSMIAEKLGTANEANINHQIMQSNISNNTDSSYPLH